MYYNTNNLLQYVLRSDKLVVLNCEYLRVLKGVETWLACYHCCIWDFNFELYTKQFSCKVNAIPTSSRDQVELTKSKVTTCA
jgi:hypothetical protein